MLQLSSKMNQDIISKRLADLANSAYLKNIPAFSDFLDMAEQSQYMDFITSNNMPPIKTFLNGGLILGNSDENEKNVLNEDFLERKIACFIPDNIQYQPDYPISIIKIEPVNMKFTNELTHRDFLGSIMNLGIERHLLGDILVKDNKAYVFCVSKMADYIKNNLTRIKHTTVKCCICNEYDFDYQPVFKEEKGSVASERLDAVIAFAFNLSRNEAAMFISSGKVFVCGREISSKSHILKYGDIVSVRGKGRFIFDEVVATTKKGRFFIKIRKYA